MKILLATSEMAPFAKTGGLADVAGALPKAMAALGHDVAVVMPFYRMVDREKFQPRLVLPGVQVDLPVGRRSLDIWRTELPGRHASDPPVAVYLVEDRGLFNRPQLYGSNGGEYADNALRYGYFCQAALGMLKGLGWMPDVIHCNDWQTALIPTYLANLAPMRDDPEFSRIRVLFSIHNMSYQGIYPATTLPQLGLPLSLFRPDALEFYTSLNLLKGGLLYSHELTTVSPQYAREIQTPALGCGLEGVLQARAAHLTGILNGIDISEWNPETDPALPTHYSRADKSGKAACKRFVQERFKLPVKPEVPLLAIISRMVHQKGFDILVGVLSEILAEGVQFVLLGTGQPEYEEYFRQLRDDYPEQVGLEVGFNDALARQIEAGADMFLMPSHFEPCGLNQLYSLRYGTVPIVRRTGGLADSVVDATDSTIVWGKGTGFVFGPYADRALRGAIKRAIALYRHEKASWAKLVDNGMAQDFSWDRSAREYETLILKMTGQAKA